MDLNYQYFIWDHFGPVLNFGGWLVPVHINSSRTMIGVAGVSGGIAFGSSTSDADGSSTAGLLAPFSCGIAASNARFAGACACTEVAQLIAQSATTPSKDNILERIGQSPMSDNERKSRRRRSEALRSANSFHHPQWSSGQVPRAGKTHKPTTPSGP